MRPLVLLAAILAAPALAQPVFTVTSTANAGSGTLRDAIDDANDAGGGRIEFALPGEGVHRIRLSSSLPEVEVPVEIDGLTQPGASCAPWPPTILIEVDGSGIDPNGPDGPGRVLEVRGGDSILRGIAFFGFSGRIGLAGSGIRLGPVGRNRIECTFVGLRADGSAAEVGIVGNGIILESSDNVIGGTAPGARNVIGDTYFSVSISADGPSGNRIEGNYIGVDPTGTVVLDATTLFLGGTGNTLGGTAEGAGNIVAGNVSVQGVGNRVQGNLIGTDASGANALDAVGGTGSIRVYGTDALIGGAEPGAGNVVTQSIGVGESLGPVERVVVQGNHVGVDLEGEAAFETAQGVYVLDEDTADVLIGGDAPGAGNVIGGPPGGARRTGVSVSRGATGVRVIGNWIGTDRTGTLDLGFRDGIGVGIDEASGVVVGSPEAPNVIGFADRAGVLIRGEAEGNTVSGNLMVGVGGLHVDLATGFSADGPTSTDPGDADEGPNRLQNAPEVTALEASDAEVAVTYSVDTAPQNAAYPLRVEAFAVSETGAVYLGADEVPRSEARAERTATFALEAPLGPGVSLVLTATDADGNTGESTAPRGLTAPVATERGLEARPLAVAAWPNPASGRLSVRAVGAGLEARIELLDALGRRVAVGEGPGLDVEAAALAPGVYVVRVVDGGRVATRAVTVAR